MWLYFNNRGQLVKLVEETDSPARVGTQNFQIFAVFEGMNDGENNVNNFKIATIKLRKPDLDGSEYPLLLMDKTTKKYVGTTNNCFTYDTDYVGFLFDFGNFNTSQDDETLLDTPGLWEAIVTVANNNKHNFVQGIVKFNVEGSGGSRDGYEMTIDEVLDNLYDEFLPVSGGELTGGIKAPGFAVGNDYGNASFGLDNNGNLVFALGDNTHGQGQTGDLTIPWDCQGTVATQQWVNTILHSNIDIGEHGFSANRFGITRDGSFMGMERGDLSGASNDTEDDLVFEAPNGNIKFYADDDIIFGTSKGSELDIHTIKISDSTNSNKKAEFSIFNNNQDNSMSLRIQINDNSGQNGNILIPSKLEGTMIAFKEYEIDVYFNDFDFPNDMLPVLNNAEKKADLMNILSAFLDDDKMVFASLETPMYDNYNFTKVKGILSGSETQDGFITGFGASRVFNNIDKPAFQVTFIYVSDNMYCFLYLDNPETLFQHMAQDSDSFIKLKFRVES